MEGTDRDFFDRYVEEIGQFTERAMKENKVANFYRTVDKKEFEKGQTKVSRPPPPQPR